MAKSPKSTVVLGLLVSGVIFSFLQMYAAAIVASPPLTICAGFACAVVVVLVFLALGNVGVMAFGSGHVAGWLEAVPAFLVGLVAAGSIHGICVTTCTFFSVGLFYVLARVSAFVNSPKSR